MSRNFLSQSMSRTSLFLASFGLVIAIFVGCNSPATTPLKPVEVKGVVRVDGEPLADGEVLFKVPGEVPVIAAVTKGQFRVQLTPGPRGVEILAYRQAKDFDMGGVIIKGSKENFLPARYHMNSTLSATIEAEGSNELTFDVSAK